ncbi:MAG TPA: PAS domain S-box protein [Terriglobales bacterium]|nr:PAS domain S-box protein [Terriglobales bacterium]
MPDVRAVQEAEALYRGLFNRMADAVFVIDAETLRFLDCNDAACQTYGYSRKELLSMTPVPLHPPDEQELALRRLREKQWTNREYTHITKDGRRMAVEVRTTNVPYQGREAHLSIVHNITEHKQAADTLQLQSAYLEQLIESAPEGIAVLDNRHTVLRINREFTRMFGYRPEEIVGKTLEALVPGERGNESNFILGALDRGQTINVETIRCRRDSSPVEVSILGTPINVSGSPVALYLIYRDITQSKRAERALIESESKFRAVAETAASAIYIHDKARFLYVNRACEQISGYSRAELMVTSPWRLVHPEFIHEAQQREERHLRGEKVPSRYEFKLLTRSGETRWLDLNANHIRFEDQDATLAIAVDVTERKRAEELQRALYRIADQTSAATDLQAFYRAIHRTVGELMDARNFYIALYDEDSGLLSFPYFADQEDPAPAPRPLGKGLTEYVLRTGEPLLASPERFAELVRSGEVETIGAPSIDWLGVPVKKGDKPFGVLVVQSYTENVRYGARDMEILNFVGQHLATAVERKRAENALRQSEKQLWQSQKMEAVGRLAGGVAHDFNNLLTVIKGYTELMLSDLKPLDPMRPEMEEVQKAADRAAALTRQMLAFSRRQVLAPKVVNLNYLVEDMNKLLRRLLGEDIDLCISLDDDLGCVKADPGQIEQVIMNLAVNARDAMPRGGKLTLETANLELDQSYSREHAMVKPGAYVMLAITDTGSGMDAETLSHVFEPFFTTKEQGKGTGLGLSTVYGIVKQSGGYIWPYSEPGMGTTFKIYLPRVDEMAERAQARTQAPPGLGGTETILLVEDEEGVRGLTRQLLQRHGYTVLEAEHGQDALLLCERYSGPIHLLLSDVVLAQMSGRELVQRLTPLRPEMKVLYMSGYSDEAIFQHGVLEHGTAFLQKPFTTESLMRKLREVLDQKKMG